MPRNGSGAYNPPGTDFPAVPSTLIESTKYNNVITDIGTAISGSISADGQTTVTANIPMNSKKLTGLAAGGTAGDSVRYEQVGSVAMVETVAATAKTALVDGDIFSIADSETSNTLKKTTFGSIKTIIYSYVAGLYQTLANKDATGGYAGLTLFKINFKNAADTFTSFFTNSNTAARTYTFQDRDGTIADLTDISGISTSTEKLPQISVTQGTGALTIAGVAKYLDFRSATLTSGTPSTVNADPADLVIPSGATLGSVTTVSARIIVVEMNNAGTSEYAVANISGGLQMDETNLISTTAIDTASDSGNVWYSTTARSSLPYRVVACFDAVNTAGAWGDPTLVQPAGGNALTAMGSIGYGQTWQDMVGSRSSGVTYYNTTGKPILSGAWWVPGGNIAGYSTVIAVVNGVQVFRREFYHATNGTSDTCPPILIPANASYSITISGTYGTLTSWPELR